MKSRLSLCILTISILFVPSISKQADIGERKNRASFRAGYLIGYLSSDDLPLALNYERFLGGNFTVGGSLGHILIPKYENEKYYMGEVSVRRYFFGNYQRMALSLSAFSEYDNIFFDEFTTALTAKIGYLWEWKYIFTSLETGLGPGFYKTKRSEEYKFNPKVVDAYLNLGFIF